MLIEFGRVDVRVADHELFQNVVLNCSGQLLERDALFFGGHDVERHDRQHRAVHGHRDAHLIERNPGEEDSHVVDRINRDSRHADVAEHARIVGVVAAVGRQVERDGEPLLTGGEVASIERIALFGGREARVLTNGPRLLHVHRRVRSAQKRRMSRHRREVRDGLEIVLREQRGHLDALRGDPRSGHGRNGGIGRGNQRLKRKAREIGKSSHDRPLSARRRQQP
jgi:hypothetical protein